MLALLAALTGCAMMDNEHLDHFSMAYTNFYNVASRVDTCVRMLVTPEDTSVKQYWEDLHNALDARASDEGRLNGAAQTLLSYRVLITPLMLVFDEDLEKCDLAVGKLVETANAIRDEHSRQQAIEIAHNARALYSA